MNSTEKSQPNNRGKVLLVVENLSVPFDRRVWRECQALCEAGYEVSAISPMGVDADKKRREIVNGVSIFRYPIYQSNGSFASYILEYGVALIMSFWLMCVVLFRKGFDVVQICNPPDLLILVALPFKLLGKKLIFDQHDLSPEIYQVQKGEGQKHKLVLRVLLWFEKITYYFSDVVMVVNESCRKIAVGRGAKHHDDVFVVRNGPSAQNLRNIQPNKALRNGKKYLLSYVGMMGPQEGIDLLLRSIQSLGAVHGRTDFHVRIMGGGTVLGSMKKYAADLGVGDIVTFTGSVDYPQVMEGIASADLCLCPDPKTPLSDKCSLVKAVEYMSLGRPFVAFDLEEVRRFGVDAGIFAQPNQEGDFAAKINELLNDEERRATMGAIGRERVTERLTWEHSKEALYAAYKKAFGKKVGTLLEATQ